MICPNPRINLTVNPNAPVLVTTTTMTTNPNHLCPITQAIMTDPVIGSDGITYERSAIEAWFAAGNSTSPMTRQPMTSQSLVPNYALKALIEEAGAVNAATAPPEPKSTEPLPQPAITVATTPAGSLLISVSTPDTGTTLPTLFIDCLDISGSMGSSSVDTSTQGTSDAAVFSRADLVRHSVATQIELLRPQDEMAVVLFDNNATVALDPTNNKAAAKAVLPLIQPTGGTNFWVGLQRALTLASRATATTGTPRNVVILFQTDGETDQSLLPPRGLGPTLRSWLDTHPGSRLTIHTIGYGYGSALDTPLLREIAEIGGGTYNYIPDGSMVGTVFIHLMANLMSAQHTHLHVQIPDAAITRPVGFLQGGQSRDIVITGPAPPTPFTVAVTGPPGTLTSLTVTEPPATTPTAAIHDLRTDLLAALREAYVLAEAGDLPTAAARVAAVTTAAAASPLLTDIVDPHPYRGQISKAFASAQAWTRWGRHYVPGVIFQHENQWATNFKDESSKVYGGPTFRSLVDRGDTIFNSLPPPTASCAAYSRSYSAAAAPLSMASTNSAVGPCFLGASRMKMADGTEKRCDEIQPGDVEAAGYRIRCVIKTLVPYADVVRLENRALRPADAAHLDESGGFHHGASAPDANQRNQDDCGGFTLWHPVFVDGRWQHPADVGRVERVATDAIYNYVLEQPTDAVTNENPGVVIINGIMTCTMGHGMTGPVIGHPYFGRREPGHRNILDDLEVQPGWSTGYITWSNLTVTHDAQGLIAGMCPK